MQPLLDRIPNWTAMTGPSLAILTQQISSYHAARYRAAAYVFGRIAVISAMNDADFPEFLGGDVSGLDTVRLFNGRDAYIAAVRRGEVWSATRKHLDQLRPQVIAVAGWSFPESLAAIAWAHENCARVVMMSASQQQDGPRHNLREAVKARIVSACDAALVGGRLQGSYVMGLGIPREHVFQGYDVVDNRHFSEGADRARADDARLRQAHGLPQCYILASARFIPKKNLKRLVEAFARVHAHTPHALVILGDGPCRLALQSAIGVLGLEHRVVLPGFKSYDSLPVFYGLADAFVHVSLAEQWGLVINEGAAAGLPLVVSRPCGAAAELVRHGVNGHLVDPNDIGDMARALQLVLTATGADREKMGRESRRIVAGWGPERFAQGLRGAADAALDRPPRWLPPWDRLLLRALARRYFSAVS